MKNILFTPTALFVLCLYPGFAAADNYATTNMMMGEHSMGATVASIDHKTGFMNLKTGMGMMTLHYPAPTLKDLKKGDKITVNLSFTKNEGMKDDGMMKMK
jgi:hypothetical protein